MDKVEQAKVPLWQFGDSFRDESAKATIECPNPERWTMMDELTPEIEVLKTIHALVILLKPNKVLTVGDRTGYASLYIAQALRENGAGEVRVAGLTEGESAKAQDVCLSSGHQRWVLFGRTEDLIHNTEFDLMFLGQNTPMEAASASMLRKGGIALLHGRRAANIAENVSILNLPTPRGLLLVQK